MRDPVWPMNAFPDKPDQHRLVPLRTVWTFADEQCAAVSRKAPWEFWGLKAALQESQSPAV